MLPLTRYMLGTGIILLIPGGFAGYYGLTRMKVFFDNLSGFGQLTVKILLRELIFPHTLFLFGFGCFAFGLVLVTKGIVFHRQQGKPDSR